MKYLVISSSLNPHSNSRKLARQAYEMLAEKHDSTWLDLKDIPLPQCDGDSAYADANVHHVTGLIKRAHCILLAVPIYNYDAGAAAKNLIELTGSAWSDKLVGFMCAAGGRASYMSIMGLANSLMLDFRSLIIPRFVYADSSEFSNDGKDGVDSKIKTRVTELVDKAVELSVIYQQVPPIPQITAISS